MYETNFNSFFVLMLLAQFKSSELIIEQLKEKFTNLTGC